MWSAEEQTMVDIIKMRGLGLGFDVNREYVIVHLHTPDNSQPLLFRDDTKYGAIRKVFNFVTEGKGSKYA